jgi:pyruvate kinase
VVRDPTAAVAMMASIACATERELPYGRWLGERSVTGGDDSSTIAFGAVGAIFQLDLKGIVSPTLTGRTARLISARRPKVPVLALSPRLDVVRRCSVMWGIHARLNEEPHDTPRLLEVCADAAKEHGIAKPGEKIGITAGLPAGLSGGTNLFKVELLS